ncbi:proline-rich receptor-like protein kinase PERK10 [Chenopodium quinoa]|uniref:Uncharacterized protein n=1 Tax=Chenopodium quinoa TaxID=63459 RepID=A0A803MNU6_CHEQI|nr:proline-rich receptor-like protein kinase PERK10 [Chenopodium quinoa]
MTNCISSSPLFNLLKRSIPLYAPNKLIITPRSPSNHLTITPRPLATSSMSTTPPEFPTRRTQEVNLPTPVEMPPTPSEPNEFIIAPEPEIKPHIPPPDPTPNPPGPEIPHTPIPGPDIFPPPEVPPRQPPDVVPPNVPEIDPPPSKPMPDIIPPTAPLVVL